MQSPGSYRFGKQYRLLDAASFSRVFEKPSRSADKWFTVLCRRNNKAIARLGLAISKKHCKPAAGRNRLKRIVRESFRKNQQSLAGLDIVVMNRPPAAGAQNGVLFDSLERHWGRCSAASKRDDNSDG